MARSGIIKCGKKQRNTCLAAIAAGIAFLVMSLIFKIDEKSAVIMLISSILVIICGIILLIFSVRSSYEYNESGFSHKPEIGKKRNYTYYDIKAAYNYEFNYRNVHQKGIKLIMNDGKKYTICDEFPGAETFIEIVRENTGNDKFYNDSYCYSHNIKEL
ncbi:hypothetical protein [Porcipelethomonas sp.]|uniref:hypothetical protein n=1 Tax=Porcipelethomonas sp. TaxID=2981675 RepID=UPI003EF49D3A